MKEVVWSPEAEKDFDSIVEYLINKWGNDVATDFANEADRIIQLVTVMPDLFPFDDTNIVRKAVVVEQISIMYRHRNSIIEIVRFWDNRQNPARWQNQCKP